MSLLAAERFCDRNSAGPRNALYRVPERLTNFSGDARCRDQLKKAFAHRVALKIAAVIARLAPDEKPLRPFLSAESDPAQLAGGIKQGLLVNHLHF
ncbi:hypothetical protein ALP23_200056 [Pseudomonas syringae pv. apii]|uniref:Uncharacterized protein n=1 Tax=Pseudomonas syringae pv. apii TaxID=81036 RepID=A0A3M5WR83_9PSED|nr:hypothetical protein ALP23_200056 [Pseudomonas syringae pv. apii]